MDVLSVFLLSSVKFGLGGIPLALAMGFSYQKTVAVTSLGAFVGAVAFVYLSDALAAAWSCAVKFLGLADIQAKITRLRDGKPKKIFTRTNKLVVGARKKFGLAGLAILTPFIISIPVGCFLATRYFDNKKKILAYMGVSIVAWGLVISSVQFLFK